MGLFSQKNTGKDAVLTVLASPSPGAPPVPVATQPLTSFKSRRTVKKLVSDPLSGPPIVDSLPHVWEGEFDWDRQGASWDGFIATIDRLYYSGAAGSIQVVIDHLVQEPGGAQSQFQYPQVALDEFDSGDWKKEAFIKQTQHFTAGERVQVS